MTKVSMIPFRVSNLRQSLLTLNYALGQVGVLGVLLLSRSSLSALIEYTLGLHH